MNRREFCSGVASLGLASMAGGQTSKPAAVPPYELDPNPAGGYTPEPPRQFLFTDYRHIDPGDVGWTTPEGKGLPVADPPAPPVRAIANAQSVAQGIRLVAQRAVKQGALEGVPSRLLYEDGVYRAWSLGVSYGEGKDLGSYSVAPVRALRVRAGESRDGYKWTWTEAREVKPPPVTGVDGECFFIDPAGPPEERYKCLFNARVLSGADELYERYRRLHPRHRDVRIKPSWMYCLFGMVSPDGQKWSMLPEPLLIHMGDTDNTAYYDAWLGKYVLYTRLYWMDRRIVARSESDDFRHWTPVEPMLLPRFEDPLGSDIYTNGRTSYPGMPSHHLMFPVCYRRLTQDSEVHLHSSFDGIHWDRLPGGPVLESGEPGAWDSGFLVAGRNMVPFAGDRVGIPYSGTDHPHKYPRWPGVIKHASGFATWQRGRLVAVKADAAGSFRTFEIEPTGKSLRINARVARAGEIRVGLSGVKGRATVDCDPIIGDSLAHPVTWKGQEAHAIPADQRVRVLFQMRAAEIFGFEWV